MNENDAERVRHLASLVANPESDLCKRTTPLERQVITLATAEALSTAAGYQVSFGDYETEEVFWNQLTGYTIDLRTVHGTKDVVVVGTTRKDHLLAVEVADYDDETSMAVVGAEHDIVSVTDIEAVFIY